KRQRSPGRCKTGRRPCTSAGAHGRDPDGQCMRARRRRPVKSVKPATSTPSRRPAGRTRTGRAPAADPTSVNVVIVAATEPPGSTSVGMPVSSLAGIPRLLPAGLAYVRVRAGPRVVLRQSVGDLEPRRLGDHPDVTFGTVTGRLVEPAERDADLRRV